MFKTSLFNIDEIPPMQIDVKNTNSTYYTESDDVS